MVVTIFIIILGGQFAVKCIGGNWCEPMNPKLLNDLISLGGTELLFEIGTILKIYRGKDKKDD